MQQMVDSIWIRAGNAYWANAIYADEIILSDSCFERIPFDR